MALKKVYSGITFQTSIDLKIDDIVSWFELISKSFPEYSVFRHEKDEKEYVLRVDTSDLGIDSYIGVYSFNIITIAFGSDYDLSQRRSFFKKAIEDFYKITNITPFKLEVLEFTAVYEFEYQGNHTSLIMDTFFKDSPISKMFKEEDQRLYDNDLKLRGKIKKDKICIIELRSGNTDSEINANVFDDEKTFSIRIKIGQTKNLSLYGQNLTDMIIDHDEFSTKYVDSEVKEYVITPINEFLNL